MPLLVYPTLRKNRREDTVINTQYIVYLVLGYQDNGLERIPASPSPGLTREAESIVHP